MFFIKENRKLVKKRGRYNGNVDIGISSCFAAGVNNCTETLDSKYYGIGIGNSDVAGGEY